MESSHKRFQSLSDEQCDVFFIAFSEISNIDVQDLESLKFSGWLTDIACGDASVDECCKDLAKKITQSQRDPDQLFDTQCDINFRWMKDSFQSALEYALEFK